MKLLDGLKLTLKVLVLFVADMTIMLCVWGSIERWFAQAGEFPATIIGAGFAVATGFYMGVRPKARTLWLRA